MNAKTRCTRYLHAVAIIFALTLGAAAALAQDNPVKMRFSGSSGPSAASLIQNAFTSDYNFSGRGSLGSFDFQSVSASVPSQQPPSTCSSPGEQYGDAKAGSGVFRFEDGSLLLVTLTQGSDCINPEPPFPHAICIRVFRITGGTGRFAKASGNLTFTETLVPVPSDPAFVYPVALYAATGVVEGAVSGVGREEGTNGGW